MKTQILPNWCKKLGLAIFILFSILGGGDDFSLGLQGGWNSYDGLSTNTNYGYFTSIFGESFIHIFYITSIFGMIIYLISKEKIEDDYVNKLRLESFQLTAIIGLLSSLFLYVFTDNLELTLDYFIILFLWVYFIVFFIKKRNDS